MEMTSEYQVDAARRVQGGTGADGQGDRCGSMARAVGVHTVGRVFVHVAVAVLVVVVVVATSDRVVKATARGGHL